MFLVGDIQVPVLFYNTNDFNFIATSCPDNQSPFDNALQKKWKQAEDAKIFRYILNIKSSKILKGKYKFLVQLNLDRTRYKRLSQSITSMLQPFNPRCFNFTQLTQQEILFDIGNSDANDIIAINVSPLGQCHCLLLTERLKCLPQIITKYSLHKAIELCLLSNSRCLRIIFNSLCAYASINHLHWHLYYLEYEMLLEYIDICTFASGVDLLLDYPAKGFCLKLSSFKKIQDFISQAFLVVNYLQLHEVAHNVYITRAKAIPNNELYNDIRIYIWARKTFVGVKDNIAFIPAVCELFGHLSTGDENMYNNLTEDDVINILNDVTEEPFLLIKDELQRFLENAV